MWVVFWIVVAVMAAAIVFGVMAQNAKVEAAKSLEDRLKADHEADEVYASSVDSSCIALSFDRQIVVLGNDHDRAEYSFDQLVAVEIVKDGASLTSTNRGSQALGAAVGGLALGGVGLLAGALSGGRTSQQRVNELAIKVTVNDRSAPIHVITFFRDLDKKGTEASSSLVKAAAEKADRINAHLVNAMRRARAEAGGQRSDYATQVERLWALHQAGALSIDEFQEQKQALASPG